MMTPYLKHAIKLCALTSLVILAACGKTTPKEKEDTDTASIPQTQALSKHEIPNCVLDVEARQIKKCNPDLTETYHGFGGLMMIEAIRPDRQWVPTTGIEIKSQDEREVIRIIFSVTKWAVDKDGKEAVSETPFIGTIEKWTQREMKWRKEVNAQMKPAQPFAFSVDWHNQKDLVITLEQEVITIENIGFNIDGFSVFGSGVRVATSDLGILKQTP